MTNDIMTDDDYILDCMDAQKRYSEQRKTDPKNTPRLAQRSRIIANQGGHINILEKSIADRDIEIERLLKRPEVILGDDGYIDIDWWTAPGRVFSLSIGPKGEVACAGISKKLGDTCSDSITSEVFKAIAEFIEDE